MRCDDATCTVMVDEEVLALQAYCLVYERRDRYRSPVVGAEEDEWQLPRGEQDIRDAQAERWAHLVGLRDGALQNAEADDAEVQEEDAGSVSSEGGDEVLGAVRAVGAGVPEIRAQQRLLDIFARQRGRGRAAGRG